MERKSLKNDNSEKENDDSRKSKPERTHVNKTEILKRQFRTRKI